MMRWREKGKQGIVATKNSKCADDTPAAEDGRGSLKGSVKLAMIKRGAFFCPRLRRMGSLPVDHMSIFEIFPPNRVRCSGTRHSRQDRFKDPVLKPPHPNSKPADSPEKLLKAHEAGKPGAEDGPRVNKILRSGFDFGAVSLVWSISSSVSITL